MRKHCIVLQTIALILFSVSAGYSLSENPAAVAPQQKSVVRAAVIGGMTMTGMWQEVSRMFEAKTGCRVEVVKTGPRDPISKVFRQGKADLLTMHSGDITTDLVADGYGVNMRPWTHNNLVIVGPHSDPAGIKGMKDGAEALRKIAAKKANFVDYHGAGNREMAHNLWKKAGIDPVGPWVIKDEHISHDNFLVYAREHNAYGIIGRMPVLFEKINTEGMEIMVENDPFMMRPYMVMEANPKVFLDANYAGARALSDFLVSDEVQGFLAVYGADKFGGIPLFYPLRRAAFRGR